MPKQSFPLALLVAVLSALCGCAARSGPSSFRMFKTDDQSVLVPPGVKDPAVKLRRFDFHTAGNTNSCRGAEGGITLTPRRKGLRLAVDGGVLEQQPPGWLASWAVSLEERGCVASGDGLVLAARVVHSVPLPLRTEQRLLSYDARAYGFTDLPSGYRLRVVSPVFREGAPAGATAAGAEKSVEETPGGLTIVLEKSPDLAGYEMAWYAVEPRPHGGGSRIVPLYADFHHEGEVTRQAAPRVNHLDFDPSMAYFRMLFMSRRTETSDHDIFLVAAPTLSQLEQRTREIEAGAAPCEAATSVAGSNAAQDAAPTQTFPTRASPTQQTSTETSLPAAKRAADAQCIVAPRQVAVVAFFAVQVQGKELLLHPGTTLAQALREAGADMEQALATLAVRKPYGKRVAPVEALGATRDLLALPLSGGEKIDW
jgi:hypothetical protein